ncbi:MAG: dihydropteroate synthase [Planctomycetaceae bacterium]|nr:dihydropteroate synthase [Planctomycetaceae bacterium]
MPDGRRLLRADGLPLIMGIVNVTPDSFSDGGRFIEPKAAIEHALKLASEGADILDLGAESSRPGATPITADEEWRRLEPVLTELCRRSKVPVSVDTYRLETALKSLDAGASMINDITAGRGSDGMFALAAARSAPVCLMHMRGDPSNMQDNPQYADVVREVHEFLARHARAATVEGVALERIVVDPGFGFGKRPEHNVALVKGLAAFRDLGLVLMGLSRKSTLATLSGTDDKERLPESIAGAIVSTCNGTDILRVHDVGQTIRALKVAKAMAS